MLPGAVRLFFPGHMVWVHVHVPLTLGPGKARRSDLSGQEGHQTPVCLTRQFAFLPQCVIQKTRQASSSEIKELQQRYSQSVSIRL